MKVHSNSGQTLIEVIVAVSLIVLVLVTLVSGVALSVRNGRQAKSQAQAKEFVREGTEWIRSLRDSEGWETLIAAIDAGGGAAGQTYCLPTLPLSIDQFSALSPSAVANCPIIAGTEFTRSIQLVVNGPSNRLDATVRTTWGAGTRVFTSQSLLTLYKY